MQLLASITVAVMVQVTAFEYRENAPLLLFPYSRSQAACSLPEAMANPAALPVLDNTYFVFSGSHPYTLGGLFSSTMKAGHGSGLWGAQVLWTRTGIDVYSEDAVEVSAGVRPVKYISFGAGVQYYHLSVAMKEIERGVDHWNMKFSLRITPVRWLSISFMQEGVMSYVLDSSRKLQFPEWSLGAAVRPVRGFEINWNINSTAFGYVNTLAASANLMKFLVLGLGYSKETVSYAVSLSAVYRHIAVSYGLRYHTHLGMTHSVSLTLGLKSMEVEPVSYGKRHGAISTGAVKKIDINACGEDELDTVPVLSPLYRDRIIRYRRVFGPLSLKALTQIGMSRSEINDLLD